MTFTLLQAAQPAGGGYQFLIMIVLMIAIMWFFMIRPQQKKQKEIQKFRNSIQIGTQVVTAGGIFGTVRAVKDDKNALEVEIASGVKVLVDRNSVYSSAPTV